MSPTCKLLSPKYGLGRADVNSDDVIVMNQSRTCKTSELYQVANTVIVCPKTILPENFDEAWVHMPVPKLRRVTGAWTWFLQWCTANDERPIPMIVTRYILIPSRPRYTYPDLEKNLNTACTTEQ